jgi:2-polyprenyl-6-methoxyphenol hydroxylase-like FAD-dependent oxidoreductase
VAPDCWRRGACARGERRFEADMSQKHPVLIVGAGPTGLVLAVWLARTGTRFRIADKADGPGQASRAMVVQARTLEFYRQLGFAEEIVAAGLRLKQIHLRQGDAEIATVKFGDIGTKISPYPFALSYPQDEHERFLVKKLTSLGVEIEWKTELVQFHQTDDGVEATLRKDGRTETCPATYLCGCDGAHSVVRQGLGLSFEGGTYEELFFVADVEGKGPTANEDLNLSFGKETLYLVFPLPRKGAFRLIGIVPPESAGKDQIGYEDVRQSVEANIGLKVAKVNWFSKYRVHHRVTDRFSVGRAFVVGDAAHIHSPAGGQGMNTGIGDAINLAWKLAAVAAGSAAPPILDTYESERIGFARSLVATTDKLFQAMVGKGWTAEMFRTLLLPHVAPLLLGWSAVRKAQFRLVSQTRIHYPHSDLSAGKAGDLSGGDRLPWVEDLANFDKLQSLAWQVHVYGKADAAVSQLSKDYGLQLHEFPWTNDCDEAGLKRDAFYLVRPDGYIAAAGTADQTPAAREILDRFKIRG